MFHLATDVPVAMLIDMASPSGCDPRVSGADLAVTAETVPVHVA